MTTIKEIKINELEHKIWKTNVSNIEITELLSVECCKDEDGYIYYNVSWTAETDGTYIEKFEKCLDTAKFVYHMQEQAEKNHNLQKEVSERQERIEKLEENVGDLEYERDDANSKKEELQSRVEELEGELEELQSKDN